MPNVDTPDYQRGIVNAQALLAATPSGTGSATVAIPPNTETLVVIVPNANAGTGIFCTGTTTGIQYSGIKSASEPLVANTPTWFFDVSTAVDPTVTVSLTITPTATWYVYADAGTHITADASKLINNQGVQYVIPALPAVDGGDHPPVELAVASSYIAAVGAIIAAPGAGLRLRIYTLQMSTVAAGLLGYVLDLGAGTGIASCGGVGNVALTFPGQGLKLSTNSALEYEILAGAGSMFVAATYTTEAV